MSEFNNLLNGMDVIDGHLHIHNFESEDGVCFIDGFEWYRSKFGLRGLNIASLPSGTRDVSNNIICALYKVAHENTYAHAGLIYNENSRECEGMDPLTQYNELMEIGFDGIKMLEGKPSCYKIVGIPLDDPFYDEFYSACERDGTHILSHVADPEEFWDGSKASDEEKAKGWCYAGEGYPTKEELTRQVEHLLEKHPKLVLTLAHFFFLSKNPERLRALFEKYENLAVDITPGGEMFIQFNDSYEYFKDFFKKYSSRILLGTDGDSLPTCKKAMEWLIDRLYKYIATDEETDAWSPRPLKGLKLSRQDAKNILCDNFTRRVSQAPKKINKIALKAYIEKYKHLIRDKQLLAKIEKMASELL